MAGYRTTALMTGPYLVDAVARQLPGTARCRTKSLRLLGAPSSTERTVVPGIDQALADRLARRYGTEAPAVVGVAAQDPSLLRPFIEGLSYIGAELVFAARSELAVTLTDLLCRRTRAHLIDARATFNAAERAARIVAGELGWDEARVEAEVAEYRGRCAHELDAAGVMGPSQVLGASRSYRPA